VRPVAAALADLPPDRLRLILKEIAFEPGAGANTRSAGGPLLYVVIEGEISIYLGGELQVLAPGASTLVAMDETYAIRNRSSALTRVLRLSLAPPDQEDREVAEILTPEPATPLGTPSAGPAQRLLFSVDLPAQAGQAWLLFVACLVWQETAIATDVLSHPGPVGLRLLDGRVDVVLSDEPRHLPAGGCRYLPPNVPHQLVSTEGKPIVVAFGAIRDGEALWAPVTDEAMDGAVGNPAVMDTGRCHD
jgi:mannose-6-phosphate isomerase-like protein (cupin superfamily)